jgi:hypothetical protein
MGLVGSNEQTLHCHLERIHEHHADPVETAEPAHVRDT